MQAPSAGVNAGASDNSSSFFQYSQPQQLQKTFDDHSQQKRDISRKKAKKQGTGGNNNDYQSMRSFNRKHSEQSLYSLQKYGDN